MISEICIFDLKTGMATPVLRSDLRLEAPNWGPDETLIVNAAGCLYRLPLAAPRLAQIDTGGLTRLNNDHGVSPDGTQLVISDKTETGDSCIYLMPYRGGAPKRVTAKVPSWWHGWSPDGARLAYTARREGRFDIHTCAVDGSDERRLTQGFDHCDGPDYSADGRWIWFNGERDGAADLWRVPAAGGPPQRMTTGGTVDWFPHPSPDGRHVLFLAYPPGTKKHPPGRDVTLQLMPAEGGPPRVLLSMFGGQGTLNVPCWAPDGQRFAFARYARPDGRF